MDIQTNTKKCCHLQKYVMLLISLFVVSITASEVIATTNINKTFVDYTNGTINVAWSGFSGNVNISLYKGISDSSPVYHKTNQPSSGISSLGPGGWAYRCDYRIKVELRSNPSIYEWAQYNGDYDFCVGSMGVSYPNGEETFSTGQSITVSWSRTNVTDNIHIDLCKGSSNTVVYRWPSSYPNDGVQTVSLPSDISASTDYKIGISNARSDVNDGQVWDYSNSYFTINVSTLDAPTLISPSDGTTVSSPVPLRWSDVSGNNGYLLQIDNLSPMNISDNQYDAELSEGYHTWRVRTLNTSNNPGAWSTTKSFTIQEATLDTPTLISPSDGTTVSSPVPLRWSDVSGNNGYLLQIDNLSPMNISDNQYDAELSEGYHTWRVRTLNTSNNPGAWSTTKSFTIQEATLDTPTLISPSDGTTVSSPVPLRWSDVSGNNGYLLQIDNLSPMNISDNQYDAELSEGYHTWKVATNNSAGDPGDWSDTWSFIVGQVGSVSGFVYEDDGVTPLPNVMVMAGSVNCGSWSRLTYTDSNGAYTINGLLTGNVVIQAIPNSPSNYLREYYTASDIRVTDCMEADEVTVAVGADTPGVNFLLELGGSVSGFVYEKDGITPIPDVSFNAYDNSGGWEGGSGSTDANGAYIIYGLPAGSVFIRATPNDTSQNFVGGWYTASGNCVSEFINASGVTIIAGDEVSGANFTLEKGGSVSGTVYESDGITPIANLIVIGYTEKCNLRGSNGAYTDSFGKYTIHGIPEGESYIFASNFLDAGSGSFSEGDYVGEWYDSTANCNNARPIQIASGIDTPGIDFVLDRMAPVLEAPTLLSPSDGATANSPVPLRWSNVSGNNGYELQIDNLSPMHLSENQYDTELGVGYHTWRVRTLNTSNDPGAWSSTRSFTIQELAPLISIKYEGVATDGDTFQVLFTFDPNVNDSIIDDPTHGRYLGAVKTLSFKFGSFEGYMNTEPNLPGATIEVTDNHMWLGDKRDQYNITIMQDPQQVLLSGSDAEVEGRVIKGLVLQFTDPTLSAFTSDKLPLTALDTAKFVSELTFMGLIYQEPNGEAFIKIANFPNALDQDSDGLSDVLEESLCSNPLDTDTDDDGIPDGVEDANHNGIVDFGETDLCDSDSDGDGIQDGTELGYTLTDIGTDTELAFFIPDADPATTTDPTLPDSDGDGISDGDEDLNRNGRVDSGEGDPNDSENTGWVPPDDLIPPVPPAYDNLEISIAKKNLVLITHGWNSSVEAWPNQMKEDIERRIQKAVNDGLLTGEWEVRTYNWSLDAALPNTPQTAWTNAQAHGMFLGMELAEKGYDHIHFIAHSAGSNLINAATLLIKNYGLLNPPSIQCTFLDAYTPLEYLSSNTYGSYADWADHYVDTRELFYGWLDTTDEYYSNLFNFDVTRLDGEGWDNPCGLSCTISRHAFPYEYYNYTIDDETIPYGYQLAMESGLSKEEFLDNKLSFPMGGHLIVGEPAIVSAPPQKIEVEYNPVELYLVDQAESSTGSIYQSTPSMFEMSTGSPVWISYKLDFPSQLNVFTFEYEFLSESCGFLSVLFDGQPIFKGDEEYTPKGLNNSGLLPIENITPGVHTMTFRLDPLCDNQSVLRISGLKLGEIIILDDPDTIDGDQDGFTTQQGDCDDTDSSVYPGAFDTCGDGKDQDCDGVDAVCPGDIDNDGDGYSENEGDCNIADSSIHPGAEDIPNNGIDENCDGSDLVDVSLLDEDGDGYTPSQGDCDDTDSSAYPGAFDICGDGIDQNCDGVDALCDKAEPGDLNNDSCVDKSDYNILISDVRSSGTHDMTFDLNGDGSVDIADARYISTIFTNPKGVPCQ